MLDGAPVPLSPRKQRQTARIPMCPSLWLRPTVSLGCVRSFGPAGLRAKGCRLAGVGERSCAVICSPWLGCRRCDLDDLKQRSRLLSLLALGMRWRAPRHSLGSAGGDAAGARFAGRPLRHGERRLYRPPCGSVRRALTKPQSWCGAMKTHGRVALGLSAGVSNGVMRARIASFSCIPESVLGGCLCSELDDGARSC